MRVEQTDDTETQPPVCSILLIVDDSFISTFRSRRALLMTDRELRFHASPAMIGLSNNPKNG